MAESLNKNLRRLRRVLKPIIPQCKTPLNWNIEFSYEYAQYTGQEVSDILKQELLSDKPSLITRFGSDVLMCAMDYTNRFSMSNVFRLLKGETDQIGIRYWTRETMWNNAGFYPPTDKNLYRYGELIYNIIPKIDILGTIIKQEGYFEERLKQAKKVKLEDLEPWYYVEPWTAVLRGKKVLVIHPFESSIRAQYLKRHLLFKNEDMLPDFQLFTIKAVQTIAKNKNHQFPTWFDAFEWMKSEINKIDFDIAIIGCGSYGMPLAAYVKDIGKKAVHLGGATQLLFGIKGKRWEEDGDRTFYKNMFTEHWIRPLPEDYPEGCSESGVARQGCGWQRKCHGERKRPTPSPPSKLDSPLNLTSVDSDV